ncbi:MAG: hypothetical protein SGJ13_09065 [Actinomycetota bacterium]|nr:hypothetical protein [Actinomycetota bacterium]
MKLTVELRVDGEWELFDLMIELFVADRKAGSKQQLTELIELGGLQRDGITGLNVHRQSIVAEAHP